MGKDGPAIISKVSSSEWKCRKEVRRNTRKRDRPGRGEENQFRTPDCLSGADTSTGSIGLKIRRCPSIDWKAIGNVGGWAL